MFSFDELGRWIKTPYSQPSISGARKILFKTLQHKTIKVLLSCKRYRIKIHECFLEIRCLQIPFPKGCSRFWKKHQCKIAKIYI